MYKYNLVIYHVPKRQGISDFMTIRNIMAGRAPDIEVHILSTGGTVPPEFWRMVAARPTVIFSPSHLVGFDVPARGRRLISVVVNKLKEIETIASTGAPVPETRLIMPDTRLDEAHWGPFTVVKPTRGLRGNGIRLMRTRDVRWSDTSLLPKDDPRHGLELLAQRYVDTGPYSTCYRVLTVLGRPIYCMKSTAIDKRPAITAEGVNGLDLAIAANSMRRNLALVDDREIIALAASVHAGLPHLPVMGVDIIREEDTGRLFVLEYNSGGGVWHLSSHHGLKHQHDFKLDYYGQFNALDTITNALIEATRKYAV